VERTPSWEDRHAGRRPAPAGRNNDADF